MTIKTIKKKSMNRFFRKQFPGIMFVHLLNLKIVLKPRSCVNNYIYNLNMLMLLSLL